MARPDGEVAPQLKHVAMKASSDRTLEAGSVADAAGEVPVRAGGERRVAIAGEPGEPGELRATVAVCTYNGADRLPRVLAALERQTFPMESWEVVVVDNASTDETVRVVEGWLGRSACRMSGRVVTEVNQGLSFARERAAREARGELVCFLDDDNIPSPDWLEVAVGAFARRSEAGVIGGKVEACWEAEPTPLAEAVAEFALAIVDLGPEPRLVEGPGSGIVGAGMCVRRELLLRIFDAFRFRERISDRRGDDLISGGDLAVSVAARMLGMECWYEPGMRMEHVLPPSRMAKPYLLRLFSGIGRGQAALRRLHDWRARSPLAWLIGLKDLMRWLAGDLRGPDEAKGGETADLARDLHELRQAQTLGRATQALRWPLN